MFKIGRSARNIAQALLPMHTYENTVSPGAHTIQNDTQVLRLLHATFSHLGLLEEKKLNSATSLFLQLFWYKTFVQCAVISDKSSRNWAALSLHNRLNDCIIAI